MRYTITCRNLWKSIQVAHFISSPMEMPFDEKMYVPNISGPVCFHLHFHRTFLLSSFFVLNILIYLYTFMHILYIVHTYTFAKIFTQLSWDFRLGTLNKQFLFYHISFLCFCILFSLELVCCFAKHTHTQHSTKV